MSRNGSLLPVEPDSMLGIALAKHEQDWPKGYEAMPYPRTAWLTVAESLLAVAYPESSSADRTLTARTLAPFALAQPGVR